MLSLKRNGAPFLWNGCAVLAEYADAQITAQDQIRTDLDKHLHEYFNNTGMSAESSDSGIISEEQMNMIISEVSSEVTPTLLKQLSLTKSEINQHAITQLE